MAENNNTESNNQRNISINAQYVKDLSFESPNAPQSLMMAKEAPKIDVSVDVHVQNLKDKTFEVNLVISVGAKSDEKNLFLVELSYAGVFTVDVPEQETQAVLMIYCPGMLFPFARRIIADATRDGGFPPLMLDPIDFAALFQQHVDKQAKKN